MSVSSTNSRIAYAGAGLSSFSYPYYFQKKADLSVALQVVATGVITTLALTTDYTITGTLDSDFGYLVGATIATVVPVAAGTNIVIYRNAAAVQSLTIAQAGPFASKPIEAQLDNQTLISQRMLDIIGRVVKLPDGFSSTFDPTLPATVALAANQSTALIINAAGNGLDIGPTTTQISNAQTYATNALASQTAAAVSQAAALVSQNASAVSAAAALVSQNAAAVSAAAAAVSATAASYVVTGTSAAPTNLVAGTALTSAANAKQKKYIQGSGGPVVVSANPQIAPGVTDGQELLLVGCSDTSTVTYSHGTGMNLNGSIILGLNWLLLLNWDAAASTWTEVSRRAN